MTTDEKPWWFPEVTDAAWVERMRMEYPDETAAKGDDEVREYFADGAKYATTWDHVGDAYDEYEKLADAYLALLETAGDGN